MFYGLWLVLLGALAVPSLVLKKDILDKIAPIQGWLGVISAFWGAWGVISAILNLGLLSGHAAWWATWTLTSVITLALGLLLGVGTAKSFIRDARAQVKLDEIVSRLSPFQGKLGIAALGLGGWCIVASFVIL